MRDQVRRAAATCLFAVAATVAAHGPLQDQIDAVSTEIAREPPSARLYLRRGELNRLHDDGAAALADYERAAVLAPGDDTIDFLRGRVLQEAGSAKAAKVALDRYLARHPEHVEALIVRARALVALADFAGASADYSRAIERLAKPDPDYYLERARADVAARNAAGALAGLDAGIAKLGPVPALLGLAIDIELQQGHYDAALAQLDRSAQSSSRKESWLARRGEILAQAGRRDEARAAYAAALASIEALPSDMRRTTAMADLESRVRGKLEMR
jgi:tetratricopeptide (TPR) repeat protein